MFLAKYASTNKSTTLGCGCGRCSSCCSCCCSGSCSSCGSSCGSCCSSSCSSRSCCGCSCRCSTFSSFSCCIFRRISCIFVSENEVPEFDFHHQLLAGG